MANTTFDDENTFCPSVPRKKGRADLLSTKTNMANTTFDNENTFCLLCNNAERMNDVTMEITRARVAIDIARESTIRLVFAGVVSRNLPTMRHIHSCLSTTKTNSLHYFWRIRLSVSWQLIKPTKRHESLRNISSPIQS